MAELTIMIPDSQIEEIAERVLDEFTYNGKSIREWADAITNPKTKGDMIRTMTDEALVRQIRSDWCAIACESYGLSCEGDCDKRMLAWMKLEVN